MTTTLKQAFSKASHLPKVLQDQLAEQVLGDIAGELKWDRTLSESQPLLEQMASKARTSKKNGKVVRGGFDQL